jgi:hypothetical protein
VPGPHGREPWRGSSTRRSAPRGTPRVASLEKSNVTAMRPQHFPQLFPKGAGETQRAYGIIRRKPFGDKVPETGLEPARPLRSPGPQPNVCPLVFQGIKRAVSQKPWIVRLLTRGAHFLHIVVTGHTCGQCWRKNGGSQTRQDCTFPAESILGGVPLQLNAPGLSQENEVRAVFRAFASPRPAHAPEYRGAFGAPQRQQRACGRSLHRADRA